MIEFWAVIDDTAARSAGDRDLQLGLLEEKLAELDDAAVLRFIQDYQKAHETAYTWPLVDAASLINGGVSDDGFAYFRDWLISRGRETYEAALADPETLAGLVEPFEAEFEDFRYVAIDAYIAKTENEPDYSFDPPGEPSGTRVDEAALSTRFPKLAAWEAERMAAMRPPGGPHGGD